MAKIEEPTGFRLLARKFIDAKLVDQRTIKAIEVCFRSANERLYAQLTPVLGSLGFRLIMTRSLAKTTDRYPFLDGLTVYEEGLEAGNLLVGMSDADDDAARAALEELLTNFCELLASLIGIELAKLMMHAALDPGVGGKTNE
jgi:hypothetical protein